METSKYLYYPVKLFEERLEDIRKTDPAGYERIMKVIDRLLLNPDDADGKMRGQYNGRMKKYVGRSGYRIIYYWCSLCNKENRRLKEKCEKCGAIPDNSVVFFDLYHK